MDNQSLALFTKDGVEPYFESRIFQKDMELFSKFGNEGFLRRYTKNEEMQRFVTESWDALASLYPVGYTLDTPYYDDLAVVQFYPERENVQTRSVQTRAAAIPVTCENPERSMQFLELVYTNQAVYRAFVYGKEDVTYGLNDAGHIDWTKNPSGSAFYSDIEFDREIAFRYEDGPASVITDEYLSKFQPARYTYRLPTDTLMNIYSSSAYGNTSSGLIFIREGLAAYEPHYASSLERLFELGYGDIIDAYREQYGVFREKYEQ